MPCFVDLPANVRPFARFFMCCPSFPFTPTCTAGFFVDLNSATELLVKTTLSDRIAWYKVWYDEMQAASRAKAPLTPNAVANRLQKKLLDVRLHVVFAISSFSSCL